MPWNANLNPDSPAYRIAADSSRYIRVLAGPGTGKSFALKRRVARLLEDGIAPKRILPVTFTKVAAEDLQRELVNMRVPGCEQIRGSTLHALGMRILSAQNVLSVTGRVARPLNRFEMDPLLYDLPARFGLKRDREKRIRAYEAAWARLQHEEPGFAQSAVDAAFERVLVAWLRFHEGMLIGEIIPELYRYLRNNPAARERSLYDHVLVDEYQDLNKAEQGVVDLLSTNAALCVVGDDDQSLYSFKHAHPEGIPYTHQLVQRFQAIQNELNFLTEETSIGNFVNRWLRAEFTGVGELQILVAGLMGSAESPSELLSQIIEAVSQPEIPPDVTEVRIMSLHKSKGLSSPVVVIAGCVDGLLPAEPDRTVPLADRQRQLEEQRRLFYVGITRVKADPSSNRPGSLLLTGSRTMSLADSMQSGIQAASSGYGIVSLHLSRFIPELGPNAPVPTAG